MHGKDLASFQREESISHNKQNEEIVNMYNLHHICMSFLLKFKNYKKSISVFICIYLHMHSCVQHFHNLCKKTCLSFQCIMCLHVWAQILPF